MPVTCSASSKYDGGWSEDSIDPDCELFSAERFVQLQYIIAGLLEKNEHLRRIIAMNPEMRRSVSSPTQ